MTRIVGVDGDARAAYVSVDAIRPDARGFVTIHSCDDDRPVASSGNFDAGVVTSNATLVTLAAKGAVCVYTSVATDLTIDVTGPQPRLIAVLPDWYGCPRRRDQARVIRPV